MTKANNLPYYPRFIFNCSDGYAFSTGDLEIFKLIKETGKDYEVTSFRQGQSLNITQIDENNEKVVKTYVVNRIQVNRIKYDLDEPDYGINLDDSTSIQGKKKKWLMEIFVYLDAKE